MKALLAQIGNNRKSHLVKFVSRALTTTAKNYSTCKKKAFAVIIDFRMFRVYLLSSAPNEVTTEQD